MGLDSAEVGHPPSKFADVFDRARAEGFRCVAHAGEEGPAGYIWEALDVLRVRPDRPRDPLPGRPRAGRPAARPAGSAHRLPALQRPARRRRPDRAPAPRADRGRALVTVNSDDPAYFGGYIDDNYQLIRDRLGIDDRQLVRLAENSFRAAFLAPETRDRHLAELAGFSATLA